MDNIIMDETSMPQVSFLRHIDDWIEYLCLLIERMEEPREKVKYQRQLRWVLGFRQGTNCSLIHNNIIAALYANVEFDATRLIDNSNMYIPIQDCYKKDPQGHAFKQIEKAMACESLFLLQGPPGTGKTTAIVEVVLQTLKQNPNARILITSETHVAVDNALDRLSREFSEESLSMMMRYQKFSDSTELENPLIKDVEASTLHDKVWSTALERTPILTGKLWDRLAKLENREGVPRWLARNLTDSHQVIGVTCNQIEHLIDEYSQSFDLAIIDECSKATMPEWIMAMSVAQKCLLVGDHKQLPPTFCSEESDALSELEGYQEQLIRDGVIDRIFTNAPQEIKGTLLTQFRMQPNIGDFISKEFYNGELLHYQQQTVDPALNFGWLTYKTQELFPKPNLPNDKKILDNKIDVEIIKHKLIILAKDHNLSENKKPLDIAIITPYKAQKRALKNMVQKLNFNNMLIEIDTVDAFQGKEASVVFFSFVRNNGSAQFYGDERRLNVALSRGKNHLYLVGHYQYLKKQKIQALRSLVNINVLSTVEC